MNMYFSLVNNNDKSSIMPEISEYLFLSKTHLFSILMLTIFQI